MQRVANLLFCRTSNWADDLIMNLLKAKLPRFGSSVNIMEIPTIDQNHFGKLIKQEDVDKIDVAIVTNQKPGITLALDKLPNLKWVHCIYIGVDGICSTPTIIDKLKEKKVTLTNSKGASNIALAEFSLGACLHFAKKFNTFEKWKREKTWLYTTTENLYQKTMLIVGLGHLGVATAKIAKNGFDMKVIGLKRTVTEPKMEFVDEVYEVSKLHEVLPKADFVVNCLPLTKDTFHLFGKKEFDMMKPTSVFVNVGRGPTVDEPALIQALKEDKIFGAGLDVFEKEPISSDSPFYLDEKVRDKTLMTFHVVDETKEQQEAAAEIFAQNVESYINGKDLLTVVDTGRGY